MVSIGRQTRQLHTRSRPAGASLQGIWDVDLAFNATPDMVMLIRKWQLARVAFQSLPPFEEIALGNLGALSNYVALVKNEAGGDFRFLRAGPAFEAWLEVPARNLALSDVRPDVVRGLRDVLEQATDTREPAHTLIHGVSGGMLGSFDVVALPLASRWGAPMVFVWLGERGDSYSLVDAMFQATAEGLVALSAKRDRDGVVRDFRIVAVNKGAAKIMRRSVEELRWQLLTELFENVRASGMLDKLVSVLEGDGSDQFEVAYPLLAGGTLPLHIGVSSMGDLLTVTLTDVGPLKAKETLYRSLFDSNPVPMWIFDPVDLRFLSVNDAAIEHYGYDRATFLTMTLLDIRPAEDHARLRQVIATGGDISGAERVWRHQKLDGSSIEVLSYATAITFDGRPARLVAVVDVTERRQAEARITHMAHHDGLTGLPNRQSFVDAVEAVLSQVSVDHDLCVLYVDLDRFKPVNDTLGHHVGDEVLKQVANRIRHVCGRGDVVARIGGDEFAVMSSLGNDRQRMLALAETIVAGLQRPFLVDGSEVVIGASVGIAAAPGDGSSADELLQHADLALYSAKKGGRGRAEFYDESLSHGVLARRAMELRLRHATNSKEFELHFQPVVEARSGEITSYEALIRWTDQAGRAVSPAEFIPLAEELGLMPEIGSWVLREACSTATRWPAHVGVAVNVSATQLRDESFEALVSQILAETGLPPSRLELEITETAILTDVEKASAILHRLKAKGVSIALDDFGTGFSSLSLVGGLPLTRIKIDRSFVGNLGGTARSEPIVRAVVCLCEGLGIAITAEGVETEQQRATLQELGCGELQGYLFGRPKPAELFLELGRRAG